MQATTTTPIGSRNGSGFNVDAVSKNIWLCVFSYLDYHTLRQCQAVSRVWRELAAQARDRLDWIEAHEPEWVNSPVWIRLVPYIDRVTLGDILKERRVPLEVAMVHDGIGEVTALKPLELRSSRWKDSRDCCVSAASCCIAGGAVGSPLWWGKECFPVWIRVIFACGGSTCAGVGCVGLTMGFYAVGDACEGIRQRERFDLQDRLVRIQSCSMSSILSWYKDHLVSDDEMEVLLFHESVVEGTRWGTPERAVAIDTLIEDLRRLEASLQRPLPVFMEAEEFDDVSG